MAILGSKGKRDGSTKGPSVCDIEIMGRDELVTLWPAIMGGPVPRAMSQGLLRRFLAFEVQSEAHGGLCRADVERLERHAEGRARVGTAKMASGARFLREWNGVTHVVERGEAGYRWNGRVFGSLSAIAKEITGAYWSGPRFFGVTAQVKAVGVAAKSVRSAKSVAKA